MKQIDRSAHDSHKSAYSRFLPRSLDAMLSDNFYNLHFKDMLPTNNFKMKKIQVPKNADGDNWKEGDGEEYKEDK